MLRHSNGQSEFENVVAAVDGIRKDRLLLDKTDHITPLLKHAAGVLRTAVTLLHGEFETTHAKLSSDLGKSTAWPKLDADKKKELLSGEGLSVIPTISVGTDDDLIRTLDSTPLSSWKDKTDALAVRFSSVSAKAAKLLEPKLQRVHLTSGTLKSDEEVKKWLAE